MGNNYTDTELRSYDATTDEALIYSSLLNSYIRGALDDITWQDLPSMIRDIDWSVYFKYYTRELDNILADPETEVLIACWKKQPTEIFGYSIKQDNKLVYIYIKRAYYNKGIEHLLLTAQFNEEPPVKYASNSCIRCVKSVFSDNIKERPVLGIDPDGQPRYGDPDNGLRCFPCKRS